MAILSRSMKCIFKVLDVGSFVSFLNNRDHIEASRHTIHSSLIDPCLSRFIDILDLLLVDVIFRMTKICVSPRFHLNKNNTSLIKSNDIHLGALEEVVAVQHSPAF